MSSYFQYQIIIEDIHVYSKDYIICYKQNYNKQAMVMKLCCFLQQYLQTNRGVTMTFADIEQPNENEGKLH